MAILTYNLSPNLQKILTEVHLIRNRILLFPIPPAAELRLRWEAEISKIYWSLTLAKNPLSKIEVAKLVSTPTPKKLNPFQKEVITYKNALTYIKQEWTLSEKEVTLKILKNLYSLALKPIFGNQLSFLEKRSKEIENLLNYLQTGSQDSIIIAGTAHIQLEMISPLKEGNERLARLLATLFLYKNGFDIRGMLTLEEFFRNDLVAFRMAKESVAKNGNLTIWLEYYAYAAAIQLKKALDTIEEKKFKNTPPKTFWRLNERQKKILTSLENPEAKITNKDVQQEFGVSQITASRDLSHLSTLGLIFSRGRGRSVFYTKV